MIIIMQKSLACLLESLSQTYDFPHKLGFRVFHADSKSVSLQTVINITRY